MKNNISVIVITKNEEGNIEECLKSVKWADEIIVVDAESSDSTIKITEKFTKNIFVKSWEGFAKQKRYALSLASNDWVLSIDADERVTDDLADEIISKDLNAYEGYFIRRENYFFGKLITTCGWEKDYQLRLFKKSKTRVTEKLVHEGFEVEGNRTNLENPLIHYPNQNLHQAIEKANKYSSLVAIEKFREGKEYSLLKLLFQPPVSFYHYYIARKGLKDGIHGFLLSFFHFLTNLMTITKLWEMHRNKSDK